jgi:hypothetical protein
MTLAVELGVGFSDDEVVVLVDGRQAWHREGVTTNYSVGIADVARMPASTGSTVEVRVRSLSRSHRVGPVAAAEVRLRADIDPEEELRLGAAPEEPVF